MASLDNSTLERRTIMRLHSLQVLLPAHMLPVNVAHVRDEKSIFFPSETRIRIYTLHTPFECFLYNISETSGTMMRRLRLQRSVFQNREIAIEGQWCVLNCSCCGRWCHNPTEVIGRYWFADSPRVLLGRSKKIRPKGEFTRPS